MTLLLPLLTFSRILNRCVQVEEQDWLFHLRCAGICQYERGGGCRIRLSEPLLKVNLDSAAKTISTSSMKAGFDFVQFRPSLELKETLLHEMIHAWMFLQKIRDQGDHGPRFQERMNFINQAMFADHQVQPTSLFCSKVAAGKLVSPIHVRAATSPRLQHNSLPLYARRSRPVSDPPLAGTFACTVTVSVS